MDELSAQIQFVSDDGNNLVAIFRSEYRPGMNNAHIVRQCGSVHR